MIGDFHKLRHWKSFCFSDVSQGFWESPWKCLMLLHSRRITRNPTILKKYSLHQCGDVQKYGRNISNYWMLLNKLYFWELWKLFVKKLSLKADPPLPVKFFMDQKASQFAEKPNEISEPLHIVIIMIDSRIISKKCIVIKPDAFRFLTIYKWKIFYFLFILSI